MPKSRKSHIFMTCGFACVVVALGLAGASYGQSASSGSAKEAKEIGVVVANGGLTVNVQNRSLKRVLEQIAEQSGLAITPAENMPDTLISVTNMRDVPLHQGLQTLLQNYNTLYQYRPDRNGASAPAHIWVYPRATEDTRPGASPSRHRHETPATHNAEPVAPSPKEIGPVEQPAEKPPGTISSEVVSADTLLDTLKQSTDPKARYELLQNAVGKGIQVPTLSLLDLAQFDESPEVRHFALALIAGDTRFDRQTAKTLMNLFLTDPDASVSNLARETLDTWSRR